jgi:hypothetical protein
MDAHDMTPAVAQALAALAECYLDEPRRCAVCQDAPGVMPLVYVVDTMEGDRVHGCCFAVCAVCWCAEDFQARVSAAIKQDLRERERAAWN